MKRSGLRYVPEPFVTEPEGPEVTVEFARQYGYGVFSSPPMNDIPLHSSPNETHVQALSETDQTAWQKTSISCQAAESKLSAGVNTTDFELRVMSFADDVANRFENLPSTRALWRTWSECVATKGIGTFTDRPSLYKAFSTLDPLKEDRAALISREKEYAVADVLCYQLISVQYSTNRTAFEEQELLENPGLVDDAKKVFASD